MNEKIVVKNFLTLREVQFSPKLINLIIGPQATGKSVLVKLLFFFKGDFTRLFLESVRKMQGKRSLDALLMKRFVSIFPPAAWSTGNFTISYENEGRKFVVTGNKSRSGKTTWALEYPDEFQVLLNRLKAKYRREMAKALEEEENDGDEVDESYIFWKSVVKPIEGTPEESLFRSDQIFIPASRTFFANLQKNIFSFLAQNIDIDPFLKDFGATYERAKRYYRSGLINRRLSKSISAREMRLQVESIINGQYVYQESQDWIVSDSRRTNLANASSGQQESLPMLIVLSTLPHISQPNSAFFIEEPEAHLFPHSQKSIMSLIARGARKRRHQYFITTHSPYVLTALNNLMMAGETSNALSENQSIIDEVNSIIPADEQLTLDMISAITVDRTGKVSSVIDDENSLIGTTIIDAVSSEFQEVFTRLLDIRFGDN